MRLCKYHEEEDQKCLELYQTACAAVFKSLDGFRGDASIKTWVHRVTLNICFKHIRYEKKQPRIVKSIPHTGEEYDPKTDRRVIPNYVKTNFKIEKKMDDKIKMDYIYGNFSPEDSSIMYYHYMGHKHTEIAEIFNLKQGTIAQRVSRIKKKIRKYMNRGNF